MSEDLSKQLRQLIDTDFASGFRLGSFLPAKPNRKGTVRFKTPDLGVLVRSELDQRCRRRRAADVENVWTQRVSDVRRTRGRLRERWSLSA
jgi:hypothetical protein